MTDSTDNTAMNGETLDIAEQRRRELKQLFPSAFTETYNAQGELVHAVDFDRLKAELGSFSEFYEGKKERYGMDWPGKRDCLKLIQTPSRATLKPCREESVDFDTTQNLFIEGDNLEVLKLLQKSYYGKVKMIYIDPPYNTGNEFIYPDNYAESLDTYLAYAGLVDNEGKKFSTNTANEGRFHSKWLNMMYPRLYLARNLLREDGVIFISIDDNEVENLRRMCDEIFGEENYIGLISRATGTRMGTGSRGIARELDYVLIYSRNTAFQLAKLPMTQEEMAIYTEKDERGAYLTRSLRRTGGENRREDRPSMFYPIETPDGGVIYPIAPEGWESRWVCAKETYNKMLAEGLIEWKKVTRDNKEEWKVYQKHYLSSEGRESSDLWINEDGNKKATREVTALFGQGLKVFDHPKPLGVMKKIIQLGCSKEGENIVLDFFSGSGTIGQAVYEQNIADGITRKFILVQLPEKLTENDIGAALGHKTIADIGKERLRISQAKLRSGLAEKLDFEEIKHDFGFKVLKLHQSNIKQWQAPAKEIDDAQLKEQLALQVDHIDAEATQEDILYELLLKAGIKPTERIEKIELANHNVFSIADGGLLICLEENIDRALIDAVLVRQPAQFICLDRAFHGNDQLKANAVAMFAAHNKGNDGSDTIEFRTV